MQEFRNYRFEDLEIWQIGLRIVREAYLLAKEFPKNEQFALTDQLKRAATSIALNIAEGSGQPTRKGFLVYIHRSKSSVLECVACAKIAVQEKFINFHQAEPFEGLLKEEYFKLIALGKSLRE